VARPELILPLAKCPTVACGLNILSPKGTHYRLLQTANYKLKFKSFDDAEYCLMEKLVNN
jgi:hypothetical protein